MNYWSVSPGAQAMTPLPRWPSVTAWMRRNGAQDRFELGQGVDLHLQAEGVAVWPLLRLRPSSAPRSAQNARPSEPTGGVHKGLHRLTCLCDLICDSLRWRSRTTRLGLRSPAYGGT